MRSPAPDIAAVVAGYTSRSARATEALAASLAQHLRIGDVLELCGELGAGKTCFVRGLAQAMGIGGEATVQRRFMVGWDVEAAADLAQHASLDQALQVGARDAVRLQVLGAEHS